MKIHRRLFKKLLDREDPWFRFLKVGGKMYWILSILFFLHIQAYQYLTIFEQKQSAGTDLHYLDFFSPNFFAACAANGATMLVAMIVSASVELFQLARRRMRARPPSPEAGQ